MTDQTPIEYHPFKPFSPPNAKVLIMGTFPPPPKRWAMEFYYPNRTNDFWKIMGLIFLGNPDALVDKEAKSYRLEAIKQLMADKGIALNDTAHAVRRLKGNASDKFLEIVTPVDLDALRQSMPHLRALVSTGEKAAGVLAQLTGTEPPGMGRYTTARDGIEVWRMPSTSRAYPLPLAAKAEYYATMFKHLGIIEVL